MALSSLFIYSDTYWKVLGFLSMIALCSTLWISSVKNMLIKSFFFLTLIASSVLLLRFIYNFEYTGIIYDSQDTIDIEQSAYINSEVLVVQKKGDAIRASSPWLKTVEKKLPDLVSRLNEETERRDLTFCVKKYKEDLSNVSNIVGEDYGNQVHIDNLLITCLKNKGYNLK